MFVWIEEEALKEKPASHAIVPVPIASYLLNEKRLAVNAIETRQDGVRCVIEQIDGNPALPRAARA
ncbi:hypothetical protein ACLB1O_12345 [Escherichia coli]